ncbi:hypothetical protein ABXN37_14785 [Piscinibacter sakaiensis]|uniref:hypothetical protein n=1 Tax=Piscinibacter sakaiensis TaxID=1547922 RepID=UPI00372A741E
MEAPAAARLWVAFGDSITDGAWHRVDTDGSWPAQWNHRWRRAPGAAAGAVGVAIQIGINDLGQAAPAQLPAPGAATTTGCAAAAWSMP